MKNIRADYKAFGNLVLRTTVRCINQAAAAALTHPVSLRSRASEAHLSRKAGAHQCPEPPR